MNRELQHIRPDQTLMARLHRACRPSYSSSAFAMRAKDGGDYLVESRGSQHSTLGASIKYKSPSPEHA